MAVKLTIKNNALILHLNENAKHFSFILVKYIWPMSTTRNFTAAFPGKYIQGEHAITALPGFIQLLGKKGLILASPTVHSKILPACRLEDSGVSHSVEIFNGECCETELKRIQESVVHHKADIIIGMGGGKRSMLPK